MYKKIDDLEERRQVMEFIENKFGKKFTDKAGSQQKPESPHMQLTEAMDDFGKGICFLFLELLVAAAIVMGVGYAFGFIKLESLEQLYQ